MFAELTEKLLSSYALYPIHYFSIGCAESNTSTIDPKYICQQFPIELQNRSENICIYLIDSMLQPITYVETLLSNGGYTLISEVTLDSFQNSSIKVFENYKNTIQLVILRSNDIYTYEYHDNSCVMPEKNFDFFTLMISLIYDNEGIGIFQTYSGQHLTIIERYCKINGYSNKMMAGITCGYDFSCFVPDTFLNKLYFKNKFGKLCIKNPNIIPNFNMRKKFLKYGIDSDYGKQLLYIMNKRIFVELRAIANLLDFNTRLINRCEQFNPDQLFYHYNIPDFDVIRIDIMNTVSNEAIRYIILELFMKQVKQCSYFLPEELRYEYTDDITSPVQTPSLTFVYKMYDNFKNIYPTQCITINN